MINNFVREEQLLQQQQTAGLWRDYYYTEEVGTTYFYDTDRQAKILHFASNNYLGLAQHSQVIAAYQAGVAKWGAGAMASPAIRGQQQPHYELQEQLADYYQQQDSILFASGYVAALAFFQTFIAAGDIILSDKLMHASSIDAAINSKGTLRTFKHNDITNLEQLLQRYHAQKKQNARIIVLTESIFSMDGDLGNIEAIVQLKKKYNFLLLVDTAHSLGTCRLQELVTTIDLVDFWLGTLGKATGGVGGYIASNKIVINALRQLAKPYIYSTAIPAAQCCAILQSLAIIRSEEGEQLLTKLRHNISYWQKCYPASATSCPYSPILAILPPWKTTEICYNRQILQLQRILYQQGIYLPAIRYPTVKKGQERLRISLTSCHRESDIKRLLTALLAAIN